jgi:hypothetical protein
LCKLTKAVILDRIVRVRTAEPSAKLPIVIITGPRAFFSTAKLHWLNRVRAELELNFMKTVATPTNPTAGSKTTSPLAVSENLPTPAIVMVVAQADSAESTKQLDAAAGATGFIVTAVSTIVEAAINSTSGVTSTFTGPTELAPEESVTLKSTVALPTNPAAGVKVVDPSAFKTNVPTPAMVTLLSQAEVFGLTKHFFAAEPVKVGLSLTGTFEAVTPLVELTTGPGGATGAAITVAV